MNISAPFIRRPVATVLLTLAIALAGAVAFFKLPVSPLPQVDFPTIAVMAQLPGASPETMATSVATPLERYLGQIADVTEMTSMSSTGSTRVVLQFGLDRDINGAARDVQAAITASRADLPAGMRSNPTYRKMNPADAPILVLTMTSDLLTPGQIYDAASSIVQQKLSQIDGIGQVNIGGSSLPAVRVSLNPMALTRYGIGLESVRAALAAVNANSPKGAIDTGDKRYQIAVNDQASDASVYHDLIVAWRGGQPVRLSDVANVTDSVENLRNLGLSNGKPAVLVMLFRQPGANIIKTVDRIKEVLPQIEKSIPGSIKLHVAMDPTQTIRASLHDVEKTLLLTIGLVVLVVFLFLNDGRATIIPSIAVPVSIIGTFAVMYLLDYSLDNLSLMALVICTGFVVDDAIVVLENIARHVEAGMPRRRAAFQGAGEVAFTVVSMSLSLIAVFIPILLMGGIVGRLFREFAMTLSIAILVSLAVSLSTTPMLASKWLRADGGVKAAPRRGSFSWILNKVQAGYVHSLEGALAHGRFVLFIVFVTIGFNVYLFISIPKGFFPQQDTGRLFGDVKGDQSISFQLMQQKMRGIVNMITADPAVDSVTAFTGGDATNSGRMFVALKSRDSRDINPKTDKPTTADEVMARLRKKAQGMTGISLLLQAAQDIRMGGRAGSGQYQYTLQSDDLQALRSWTPRLVEALKAEGTLQDVSSDQQDGGRETYLTVDRDVAARYSLPMSSVMNTLYDAFGERQVSTIYKDLNQYHVVMTLMPQFLQGPDILPQMYVSTSGGAISGAAASSATVSDAVRNQRLNQIASRGKTNASTGAAISTTAENMIPLSSFSSIVDQQTPLEVNHQGHFAAGTLSFNMPAGRALGDAVNVIKKTARAIGMPSNVQGSFQGTAKMFQESIGNQGILILTALLAVYIVLGVLYESLIHPLTILSTLPSAGAGAVLALMICDTEFSIMALIGVILLIGIVKKNAIMMIDFALDAERTRGLNPAEAIREACALRFRPIMMTTFAALFGALPLALGQGEGAELRRPLGISIVGGLLVSQLLTLYTTPVIYLYLDRARHWGLRQMGIEKKEASA